MYWGMWLRRYSRLSAVTRRLTGPRLHLQLAHQLLTPVLGLLGRVQVPVMLLEQLLTAQRNLLPQKAFDHVRRAVHLNKSALESGLSVAALQYGMVRAQGVVGSIGLLGLPQPSLLTPEEEAREVALEHQAVIGACRRLINAAFRGSHAPQWTHELRARLTAGQRRRLRFYSFIALDTPPLAFAGDRDQGYQARLSGHATIQAHNDQTASDQDFVVDCRIDGNHRSKAPGESLGSITFESISEPNFDG